MKKIISLIGLLSFAGAAVAHDGEFPLDSIVNPSISNFKVSSSVGFESEYVFRGEKRAGNSVQPKVEVAYPVVGFDIYGGAWMNAPLQTQNKNSSTGTVDNLQEVNLYAGATYAWGEFTADVGYIYYWYTSEKPNISRENEVYVGLTMDTASYFGGVNVNPSVYYFYNVQRQQHVIEASLGYEFEVGSYFNLPALTLPLRAYYGYLTGDRRNGDQDYRPGAQDENGSYMYYGGSADIAYALTEYCTVSAGVRYSQNFSRQGENNVTGGERFLWYGVKVDFGF